MQKKRTTIYHIASELGMSASYVSRALNDHPAVSEKVKMIVKQKAIELNYKQNSHAANLRQGSSKTIGVIVPQINQGFFSEVIAGIEEACYENNHNLIICQSHESNKQESIAVETLIHQNVDCILISVSAETKTSAHLEEIKNHRIHLIQFDRCIDTFESYKVLNDNEDASYKAVNQLIGEGYKRIAFIGGPEHLSNFTKRKEGYIKAMQHARLSIPEHYLIVNAFTRETAMEASKVLLLGKNRPDAFFAVFDAQSLGVLQVANSLNIQVPQQLGIFGYSNEAFTEFITPTLSSVDQKSKHLGKLTANLYFQNILSGNGQVEKNSTIIIKSEIIVRDSSLRSVIR